MGCLCVSQYSGDEGEGCGWRCLGHRLCAQTHVHTQVESFEPKRTEKSGVWCDYTEPESLPINHVDYLGQRRCKNPLVSVARNIKSIQPKTKQAKQPRHSML